SEANGGEATCASGRSLDRAAVILCAAAAYQGSFWKLSLRLGRLASRGAAFAVFCCSLWRLGINASLTLRLRLGPKFADKSAVWKLFSQHESDYASRNIGLRRSIRLGGGPPFFFCRG